MSQIIKVFTDGSSSANGKKHCLSGCGVYYPHNNEQLSLTSQQAADKCNIECEIHSNNVGELLGILVAMMHIQDKSVELLIHTDSMYCLNSLSIWWQSWSKNNWITAGGTPVKNKKIIQKILHEKGKFKGVYFKHVKAHRQEPNQQNTEEWEIWQGNDIADKLATQSVHN